VQEFLLAQIEKRKDNLNQLEAIIKSQPSGEAHKEQQVEEALSAQADTDDGEEDRRDPSPLAMQFVSPSALKEPESLSGSKNFVSLAECIARKKEEQRITQKESVEVAFEHMQNVIINGQGEEQEDSLVDGALYASSGLERTKKALKLMRRASKSRSSSKRRETLISSIKSEVEEEPCRQFPQSNYISSSSQLSQKQPPAHVVSRQSSAPIMELPPNFKVDQSYINAKNRLTSCLKRFYLKHISDLPVVKKPSIVAFTAAQLFSSLLVSLRKESNHKFNTWADIVKFLTSSAKIFQEIQSIKFNIDNLAYDFGYVKQLRVEYMRQEKLFTSNKLWLNCSSALML
jgi:hypothetical protein